MRFCFFIICGSIILQAERASIKEVPNADALQTHEQAVILEIIAKQLEKRFQDLLNYHCGRATGQELLIHGPLKRESASSGAQWFMENLFYIEDRTIECQKFLKKIKEIIDQEAVAAWRAQQEKNARA